MARHSAWATSRSKRECSVWVGVKAVKSCLPTSAAAQLSNPARSTACGHQSALEISNGFCTGDASTQ